ncbi:MAG TPA: hypothetical protein VIX42_08065, partial [Edaphobacter sp.]
PLVSDQRAAQTEAWRFPWHWVHVVVAALAMVATLPGRTHGLGLFCVGGSRLGGTSRDSGRFARHTRGCCELAAFAGELDGNEDGPFEEGPPRL